MHSYCRNEALSLDTSHARESRLALSRNLARQLRLPEILAAALLALGAALPISAQQYPSKPVRFIVPFGAGATSDISARFFAAQLSPLLGQPFYVENRPGADGAVGIMAVKNAPADGYTIVNAGSTALTISPVVVKDLPYDPVKDLKPASGLTRGMLGFVVPGNSMIKNLGELIVAAKNSPAHLNFGTNSMVNRLSMEWLASASGVRFSHVPYKTSAQMLGDLMGNQIDVAMEGLPSLAPMIRAGKLRLIGVTGEQRHAVFPEASTIREIGYPDIAIYGWSAIYVRAETPDDITEKLAQAIQKVLGSPAAQEFAKTSGFELMIGSRAAMRKFQLDQHQNFKRAAESAGIKAE